MTRIDELRDELTNAKAHLHNADTIAFLDLRSDDYHKIHAVYTEAMKLISRMQELTVIKDGASKWKSREEE